jgi:hypothetical protein
MTDLAIDERQRHDQAISAQFSPTLGALDDQRDARFVLLHIAHAGRVEDLPLQTIRERVGQPVIAADDALQAGLAEEPHVFLQPPGGGAVRRVKAEKEQVDFFLRGTFGCHRLREFHAIVRRQRLRKTARKRQLAERFDDGFVVFRGEGVDACGSTLLAF